MTTDKEWAKEEKSKIELLKKRLTPSAQLRYGREIDEMETMLDLFNTTGPKIPEKEKERMEKKITSLVGGLRASTLGGKPNMDEIPLKEAQRAKLVKASTFMSDIQDTDRGLSMAKDYIKGDPDDTTAEGHKTADTRDFEIDEDLTRMTGPAGEERGAVFTNPKTKQLEIVFRGTKFRADRNIEPYEGYNPIKRIRNKLPVPDAHTIEDLQLDYDITMGGRNWNPLSSSRNLDAEIRHPQYDTAKRIVESAKAKYPEFEPHISGYSLGGNVGIVTGNATNTNTTTFNPHTLGRNILSGSTHPRDVKHNIFRTNKDIPSIMSGAHKVEYPENYQVDVIPVHSSNSKEFNVRNPKTYTGLNDAHKLNNFYLRSGGSESEERQRQISDEGSKYLEELNRGASMRRLDGIIKFHDKFNKSGGASADDYERAEQARAKGMFEPKPAKRGTAKGQLISRSKSGLLTETKIRMLAARGGMPPIKDDGTITGLGGEQKFIPPEEREAYNKAREQFGQVSRERVRVPKQEPKVEIPEERQGEGWFSKYARQKGLSTDDHIKHLYKKALDFNDEIPTNQKENLKLSEKEKAGYDEDFARQVTGVDDNFIQDYVQASPSIREDMKANNDVLVDQYKQGFDNVGNHEVAGQPNRLANASKSFGESFGEAGREAISAKGIAGAGAGMVLGALIHKGWSTWVDPKKKLDKAIYHGDDMAESALGGAILGKAMGQGFGMGGLVGLGSTAVGLATEEGSDWALEKMGVKKNVAEGVGSGLGGAAAGATAVGLGLLGAEEGATAGAFAGPAGIAVGAVVGAGIGVASHYLGKYIKWPF